MTLLLHGIPGAKVENDDTLASPKHVTGGKLDLFDRVLSNPPFSLNYSRDGMAHQERFRSGPGSTPNSSASRRRADS
jgi:type I restriction enzyme M protein